MTVGKSKAAVAWLDARVVECEQRGEAVRFDVLREVGAWVAHRRRYSSSTP